ncbi:hypothetical protein [Spiroplasma endosymbiont of Aspidapion aeneum]|uniref:hypothetical protein n=1 Tax=Spiroplasma endosymbiont of Aspidapion aeneum TaxID=3066276 RepID=UPI00313A9FBD
MLIKTEFSKRVSAELRILIDRENVFSGTNTLNNLITKLFYVAKHSPKEGDEFDKDYLKEIADTIFNLEDLVVKNALTYEELIYVSYNKEINPQQWIDFAQSEARKASYEMYDDDELVYLRGLHISYLTWVYCDDSLKRARIRISRESFKKIAQIEKDYVIKRTDNLRDMLKDKEKW